MAANNSANGNFVPQNEKLSASGDLGFFRFETLDEDLFEDRPLPEWVGWGESSDLNVGGSSVNPFKEFFNSSVNLAANPAKEEAWHVDSPSRREIVPNGTSTAMDSSDGPVGSDSSQRTVAVPSLFEEDVEFVGVELEGH